MFTEFPPCRVVMGLEDALAALASGRPVTLLSSPGAALYAGPGWWRAVVDQAKAACPGTPCRDILDCGDAPGLAMAALRLGCRGLVLAPACPAFPAVAAAAAAVGAVLMPARPLTPTSSSHAGP